MKKNANYLLQTIDRLIYDGTSRTGRTSDDAVSLFIEKLFRRATKDQSSLLEEISNRKIDWLVHFTPATNVYGILKYGLIPRKYLEIKPLADIIDSVFPDDNRLDGMLESNCISVSFPNYQLFYKKRMKLGNDWAVILINPSILTCCPCIFYNDNAVRCIIRGEPHQSFGELFADMCIDTPPNSLRSCLQIPRDYTTNPQAEILLNSVIPPQYIRAAYVEKRSAKILIEMKGGIKFREKIWISPKYFKARQDFKYWSIEKERNADYPDDWASVRDYVMQRDGNQCVNCRTLKILHVHHVVPLSKGGTNNIRNMITLCGDCHEKLHPHMRN